MLSPNITEFRHTSILFALQRSSALGESKKTRHRDIHPVPSVTPRTERIFAGDRGTCARSISFSRGKRRRIFCGISERIASSREASPSARGPRRSSAISGPWICGILTNTGVSGCRWHRLRLWSCAWRCNGRGIFARGSRARRLECQEEKVVTIKHTDWNRY